jgi:hypothetical protein
LKHIFPDVLKVEKNEKWDKYEIWYFLAKRIEETQHR